ncbi:hypothetical protein Vretimale_14950 [Volvox reticuliferus]|uniref:Uncharacterized protein n=1 Tax=Volvox reticuliferus TaxID=1737510 RepID=A0A8J4G0V0_9CHLO|nr:hypothetical protein Vretifemale_19558 [Volvox reticuliferus]GIM11452.1 hypothetical protein Vretimale_14950 [Volvox reticuliferus]
MKLRKVTKASLLDLDDPLATDSDESDYESSEYSCLYDIEEESEDEVEGVESEDAVDTEENVTARVLGQDIGDGNLDQVVYGAARGQRFGDFESNSDTQDVRSTEELNGDEDEKREEEDGAEHQQHEDEMGHDREEQEDEEEDGGGDYNPFAVLAMQVLSDKDSDSDTGCEDEAGPLTHGTKLSKRGQGQATRMTPSAHDGEAEIGEEETEGCTTPECWLCYGKGRVAFHEGAATVNGSEDGSYGRLRGSSSSVAAATAAAAASRAAEGAGGCGSACAEDELIMPCRTCSGGLQYIHRGCFQRWLDSSWAIACPNCRTLYDSAVLEAVSCGPSVRSMLLAACPPTHDLRQPFAPGARVYFCIGGAVELSMPCGGFTAGELLRRIRSLVDDIAAAGADGGLGLMGPDGRAMQLPNFEVTGLTLETEGMRSRESRWRGTEFPDLPPLMPDTNEDDEDYFEQRQQEQQQQQGQEGLLGTRRRLELLRLPDIRRAYDWDHYRSEWDYERLMAILQPPPRPPPPPRDLGGGGGGRMSSADHRARSRLEQQRLASDLQFQQRNQQRHARGQRAAVNVPRGGGGRRRS